MKILIICQWFPPEYAPIGVMLDELAHDLSLKGHGVTIITGFPNHPSGVVFAGYRKAFCRREMKGPVSVVRCYLYTSPHKTFLRRVLNYVSFAISSFWAALRIERHDLVFMVSPPLSNGIIALLLAKLRGIPYVFNIQDIYPDAAISAGMIRNRLVVRGLKAVEASVYRGAARIAVISEGFRKNLVDKGVPGEKLAVINNWLDTSAISPCPRDNTFSRNYGLNDRFVVLYSGTIGLISGADILVRCAEKLKGYKEILFMFVGDGVVKEGMMRSAASLQLDNMLFLPFQPRELLSQVQSSADVSVVTLLKDKGKTSVPSKVLGYMAAARPIIASVDYDTDTREFIETAGCGLCVNAEDATALVAAILDLYHDRVRGRVLGLKGREYLVAHCDRKKVTSQYEDLFNGCLRGAEQ